MNDKKKQEIPIPFNFDDFFTTQEERNENKKEKIENINLNLIDNFKNHPFKVLENEELISLEESIKLNGILDAVVIRPKDDGRYEMISGHRRLLACKKLGLETIPSVVKNLSDEDATIYMVDSNMHREKLLPSEKAFAYKMKYEALKKQRKIEFDQLNTEVCQVGTVARTDELLSKRLGESARNIHRYIRLTYLIPELLNYVDNSEKKETPSIALTPAVELSYLKQEEQKDLYDVISYSLITPSHAQSIELRKLSESNDLDISKIEDILDRQKPNQIPKFKITEEKLYKVIPKNIERNKIEDYVLKACDFYLKHLRSKDYER